MRRLPTIAILLSSFALPSALAHAQNSMGRTAAQTQIVANEKAVLDAIGKRDPKAFHTYVSGDGFALDGTGLAKTSDFDRIMTLCRYTSWQLADSVFYWITDSTAVHIYKWTGKGTCGGQPVPEVRWSSTVWTNKGGKWIAGFHQESVAIAAMATTPIQSR